LKNNQIVIPLLTNFIKNKNKRMTREEISFNENGEIKKGEQTISNKLTSLEFKLLAFLMKNKDRILSREEIIKDVWSETQSTAGVTDQAIDQLVSRLRRKIEEDPNNPVYIETVKGRGIKFSN
jgi:DNA-binding response OmpR family regulator